MIRGPIIRQLAKIGSFFELASFGLFDFVFRANCGNGFCGINTGVFGVDFPQRRMGFDAFVKTRLSDGGIIHFAVPMTAITNQIDDNVTAKRRAIVRRDLADAHNRVRIFSIYVKDGYVLAFGQVCGETRGVFLNRLRGETN